MAKSDKHPHLPGTEIAMHTVDALTHVLEFINSEPDAYVSFCEARSIDPKAVYDLVFMVRAGHQAVTNKETVL